MSKRPRSDSESRGDEKPASPAADAPGGMSETDKSPIEAFTQLLDMTQVPPGTEPERFESIASLLMHGFHLCVASQSTPPTITSYELLEIEFYWYCQPTGHIDPFTHAAEEQRQGGNWYFHRAPRRVPPNSTSTAPIPSPKTSGFRGGTRKGLDLTFGIPPHSTLTAYGGILFRSLRNTSTKKVTSGPSLLVDEVLHAAGTDSLNTLVGTLWSGDTRAFLQEPGPSRMFLRPVQGENAKPTQMYTSPRIGLDLARIQTVQDATPTHPRVQYVIRPYRFFTHPRLLGTVRPQTFYGLWSLHESGAIGRAQIIEVLGVKPTQVETFAGYVNDGRKSGKDGIKEFIGEKGKGAAPSVQRFLKMAGVLECVLDIKKNTGDQASSAKKQKLGRTLTELFAVKKS